MNAPDAGGVAVTTYPTRGAGERILARTAHRSLIRRHAAVLTFAGLSVIAWAALLYIGRHATFYGDEWYFIRIQGIGSFTDWMTPWAAHWSMVPMILWRSVFAVVGLHSYLPYLALLLTAHVTAAAALFVLVRRSSGSVVAVAAGAVFLFLGSGYFNLFFSFQLGLVGSTAFGLWAMVAFDSRDRRQWTVGAVLLMASLASSGVGPVFVAAVAVELLVDARRRPALLWLLPVLALFGAWYITWGRAGTVAQSADTGTFDLATIVSFVLLAPQRTLDTITGFGPAATWLIYAALVVAAIAGLVRRRLPPRAVGAAVGFAALIVLVTIGRGALGLNYVSTQSRYVYEAAALLFLVATALLGRRAAALPRTPADGALTATIGIAMVLVLSRNVGMLDGGARVFSEPAGVLRAFVALADRYGATAVYQPPPVRRFTTYLPTPTDLEAVMARWGRLDDDMFRRAWLSPPTPAQADRALWRFAGGTAVPTPTTAPTSSSSPPVIVDASGPGFTVDGPCVVLRGASTLVIRARDAVTIQGPGAWTVGYSRDAPPQPGSDLTATLDGQWYSVAVPDLHDGGEYRLALHPSGPARVCAR